MHMPIWHMRRIAERYSCREPLHFGYPLMLWLKRCSVDCERKPERSRVPHTAFCRQCSQRCRAGVCPSLSHTFRLPCASGWEGAGNQVKARHGRAYAHCTSGVFTSLDLGVGIFYCVACIVVASAIPTPRRRGSARRSPSYKAVRRSSLRPAPLCVCVCAHGFRWQAARCALASRDLADSPCGEP